ncbi:MAG: hypothetical protein INR65_11190 [Gluconacetobacter diazotrophicus]|nr:hypothetical protein [Gluconacetobacter diazotrophicus]
MNAGSTLAALLGSLLTALAIFGGGLAVERYRHRRERLGMALALAGAIDAILGLIAARGMVADLGTAQAVLEAGGETDFPSLVGDNLPFQSITMAYNNRIGDLGGELAFRVARFLCFEHGLRQDLMRLQEAAGQPALQAGLIARMEPLWEETRCLGEGLVRDLRTLAGRGGG